MPSKSKTPAKPRPDISQMTPAELARFAYLVLRDIDPSRLTKGSWWTKNLETAMKTPTECQACAVGQVMLANGLLTAQYWQATQRVRDSDINSAFLRGLSRAFERAPHKYPFRDPAKNELANMRTARREAMRYARKMEAFFRTAIDPVTGLFRPSTSVLDVDINWHSNTVS